MHVGVVLSPVEDWSRIERAARLADELGLHSVGFWDHYHSPRPEWGYTCGFSAYGYLAGVTHQVRLVPNVINSLHYDVGVLAKESSTLALASGGRFELGIGAGDWPESFAAWGQPFPPAAERLARLEEVIDALRGLWSGEPTTTKGEFVQLDGAICTPAPPVAPRVVVGVGASTRTLRHAVAYADEVNLYAEPALLDTAREVIAESGRAVEASIVLGWELDKWPSDIDTPIREWAERGVSRLLVNVGGDDMDDRIRQVARYAQR